ncbi:hypothetical protein HID58_043123 [Brassica napus]|uniref:Uncharacterized protein n=1 Tax=Brassica napus TaxID=3708 RepID=A0ABQ8BFL1_BRANA|nr:hypothetical protein HID58_043123 [Brassica napus]
MVPHSVLLKGGGSPPIKRRHSYSGLLMLATVKVHCLTSYVIRFNDSTTLDEITESPNQVECTPPYQLDSCRVMKYQFAGTFIFANATQVKWSVQVRLFQQYSYGSRPQRSSKTANDFVLRHEGESKTRGWNQKSRGKEGQACV